jgi:hypothetical protein
LAADDKLLALLKDAGVLPAVLGLAIGGKCHPFIHSEAGLANAIQYNLEVVKKIVPHYISESSEVIPYEEYYNTAAVFARGVSLISAFWYWENTITTHVNLEYLEENYKFVNIKTGGNEEIGAYLAEVGGHNERYNLISVHL